MASALPLSRPERVEEPRGLRHRLARGLRAVIEGVLLLMVCLSPWAFGAVHALAEGVLYAGVGLLAVLWAARVLLEFCFTLKGGPVLLCLAGLFLLAVVQRAPLPPGVLGWLSPGAAGLRAALRPDEPEVLPGGSGAAAPAGAETLSLAPGATRQVAAQLLAVLVVFAVARNNLEPGKALRRLSIVAVANGTLLALFALAQFFSSPPNVLYWTFPSQGQVFGPFICRDHFPFYLNLCIGLGLGLLLSLQTGRAGRSTQPGLSGLLQRPLALWVSAGLALMASSAVFSLSRGGTLALLGCLVVFLLAKGGKTGRAWGAATSALVAVLLACALLAWFGLPRVEKRMATVWQGQALEEGRVPAWLRVLPAVKDFPVWGAGYGAFGYVESMRHGPADDPILIWNHAHNEYLESLVEGGLVGLGLAVAALALVVRSGYRACRGLRGRSAGALAVGALAALAATALHSAVDFGLHMPAIALLTTVVAALLVGLGSAGDRGEGEGVVRLGGLGPAVGAGVLLLLGLALAGEGRSLEQAGRHVLAARQAGKTEDGHERQIQQLRAALRWRPDDATLRVDLAQAQVRAFEERSARLREQARALAAAEAVLAPAAGPPLVPSLTARLGSSSAWAEAARRDEERLAGQFVVPALAELLRARAECPVLVAPHAQLAAFRDRLVRGDPARLYLERAVLLRPSDAELSYLLGRQCLLDGRPAEAWRSWRRSLECSDRYLPEIVEGSGKVLSPEEMMAEVLPARGDCLFRAAAQLFPEGGESAGRRALLAAAVALWQAQGEGLGAADMQALAQAYEGLGQVEEALAAYHGALIRAPQKAAWRQEYAVLLRRRGRLRDAERELRQVVREQPANAEAKDLLRAVLEQIIEEK
jgi:O-antigen ligase/tetratricopeptide (TPR) repeat protein